MKKAILAFLILAAGLWAQRSYTQHPQWSIAQELIRQARLTNAYGDYDRGLELAQKAQSNMAPVNAWIGVLPLYPQTVSWARTALSELGLSRPAEEAQNGAPTNVAMPWYSNLALAVQRYDEGLRLFTNAETLWDAPAYSNGLMAAMEAFRVAVESSRQVRDTQRQWAIQQATRANVSKLLAEAERQFTNAVSEQIVTPGDSNFTAVDGHIAAAWAAFRSENYASSEESAVKAIDLLNKIRIQVIAVRTWEKARARMDALLARNPRSNADLEQAKRDLAAAKTHLDAARFEDSIPLSERVLAYLDRAENDSELFAPAATNVAASLPAFYKVRLIPQSRDCFWNIAKYSFVYKDPWQWPKIYQANKQLLQNPANPNLIQPGMRFILPSITGEAREGDWVPEDPKTP